MKYLILFLICSILGHFLSFYFYEQSLAQINEVERIAFYNDWFPINFVFSISIGALPIFYLILKKLSLSISKIRLVILFLTSLITAVFLWQFKILRINKYLEINQNQIIDFDNLNLELFWICGLILGFAICLGLFKLSDINKK